MSDTPTEVTEEVTADEPVVDDQANVGAEPTTGQEEATALANLLPDEDLDNYLVKVKVDGEETEVPLREATAGYMRQQHFTKKTQELSLKRQELEQLETLNEAFKRDPAGTARAIAESAGLTIGETAQVLGDMQEAEFDPYAEKISALEAKIAAQEQQREQEAVFAEANHAITSNGLSIDPIDLIAYANEKRIGDLGVAAQLKQIETERDERQLSTNAIVQKKRVASVVAGGSQTSTGASEQTNTTESWGDAVVRKMREQGAFS